jgi:hypothetical protein
MKFNKLLARLPNSENEEPEEKLYTDELTRAGRWPISSAHRTEQATVLTASFLEKLLIEQRRTNELLERLVEIRANS